MDQLWEKFIVGIVILCWYSGIVPGILFLILETKNENISAKSFYHNFFIKNWIEKKITLFQIFMILSGSLILLTMPRMRTIKDLLTLSISIIIFLTIGKILKTIIKKEYFLKKDLM